MKHSLREGLRDYSEVNFCYAWVRRALPHRAFVAEIPYGEILQKCMMEDLEVGFQCRSSKLQVQGGSNMTGTDLCVNKPHCATAVQCDLFTYKSVPVIFEPPCTSTDK